MPRAMRTIDVGWLHFGWYVGERAALHALSSLVTGLGVKVSEHSSDRSACCRYEDHLVVQIYTPPFSGLR